MLRKIRVLLPLLALLVLSPACLETYQDAANRARYNDRYSEPDLPAYEQYIGSIYFSTGSAHLSRTAKLDLARMAERLRERRNAGLRVRLVGYADRRRGVEENSELAAERAQNVAIALEKMGIELESILIDGRPVRLTRPRIGERRVDIYLEKRAFSSSATLYPILVAFFLVTVFVVAAIIFRRRS